MSTPKVITLKQIKAQLKELGFKLKTKRNCAWIAGEIIHIETKKSMTSIMTRADYELFLPAIELRIKTKGRIFEHENKAWRVVL